VRISAAVDAELAEHGHYIRILSASDRRIPYGNLRPAVEAEYPTATLSLSPTLRLAAMMSAIDAIRSSRYLYLEAVTEPRDNQLRLVILEATTGDTIGEETLAAEPDMTLRSILTGAKTIDHLEGCRKFELFWESYIGYSVVNESYSNGEPETSKGKGHTLVEYESSNYLEYLSKATFATADYPGPYRHWAIYCLNHTIDVASQVDPVVRELLR
jgi:hypothetical protein